MGTCDGNRAAAAALRLVDDVAGDILNIMIFIFLMKYIDTQLHEQTLTGRDRCEHGLSKRLQLERRNGGGLALSTREGWEEMFCSRIRY